MRFKGAMEEVFWAVPSSAIPWRYRSLNEKGMEREEMRELAGIQKPIGIFHYLTEVGPIALEKGIQ